MADTKGDRKGRVNKEGKKLEEFRYSKQYSEVNLEGTLDIDEEEMFMSNAMRKLENY